MQLFPERARQGRRLLLAAALVSLIVHLVGGSVWSYLFRIVNHSAPPEEPVTAKIETIAIERRPKPTPSPTPTPRPVAAAMAPRHTAVRAAPQRVLPDLPRFAVPSLAPQAEPTVAAARARVYRPRSRVTAMVPVPRGARGQQAAGGTLSNDAIAALEGSFRKTIDQAQAAVAATPVPQRQVGLTKQYNDVLRGSIDDIVGGEGICNPMDDGKTLGVYTYYYLTCSVRYTDGYTERVSFPWPFRFTRRENPFAAHDGLPHRFPPQPPPAGFVLPHPFALSRALCMYYHDECAAVLERERASGGPGNGGS